MRADSRALFQFSPLQSEFAKKQLPSEDIKDLKSLVVMIDGQTYRKAQGVLKALIQLGGIWKLLTVFTFIPNWFLNFFYDLIASNRYNLFGKKDTCRLPTPEEKIRFIL